MSSVPLSEMPQDIRQKVLKAGLNRWKLESLTGLFGIQAMQKHQQETERNMEAENRHVRKSLWGYDEPPKEEDMHTQTILGDVTHPTPIVISQPQQQSSGLGKVLAGAAIAAGLLGIPAAGVAGYLLSKSMDKPGANQPTEDNTVDIGLRRIGDLIGSP
jgi:hypothetical protein